MGSTPIVSSISPKNSMKDATVQNDSKPKIQMSTSDFIKSMLAVSTELGEASRKARQAAQNADACRDKIADLIWALCIDGHATINDVRRASHVAPLAQENGTAVTGADADGDTASSSGVGKGPAEGGAALGDTQAHEAGQVLAGTATSQPQSNPALVAALEKIEGQGLRHSIITLYHETDCSLEFIARTCGVDVRTIDTILNNSRNAEDTRVLRGDEARKSDLED